MEANVNGFRAASYPCDFDICEDSSATQAQLTGLQYGSGEKYLINTEFPFHVRTRFFKNDDGMLSKVETTLTQNDRSVRLNQDDPDFLASLSDKLTMAGDKMATVIATNDLGLNNNLSSGTCED